MISKIWKGRSPLIDSWSFMGTPYPMLAVFAVYLMFVFKLGPKFMENRKAFKLNNIIRVYNVIQVLACTFILMFYHHTEFSFDSALKCDPVHKGREEVTPKRLLSYQSFWCFVLFRAFEFCETIFFVLRKKQNQVSLLHVYHHMAVVSLLWLYFKYSSSCDGFIILLNTAVHSVMYSYYFMSSFESLKKLTALLKPLITSIQIIQLVLIFLHCVRQLTVCEVSKVYYLQAANLAFLIFMFLKFYWKSYCRKEKSKCN